MTKITFSAELLKINSRVIVHLPLEASAQLPSRGLVMVKGSANGVPLHTALEPDGKKSHWFELDSSWLEALGVGDGDTVRLEIEPTKDWTEPQIPQDILDGLVADASVYALWQDITPMARWEWIRWIRATNRAETRASHIEVACSKLRAGSRRPCCFNASMCSDFTVAKNGVLLDPTSVIA